MTPLTSTGPRAARTPTRRLALSAGAPLLLLALTACGGAGSDAGTAERDAAGDYAAQSAEAPQGAAEDTMSKAAPTAVTGSGNRAAPGTPAQQRALISTGVVSVAAKDAGAARAEIEQIVDVARGQITEEKTTTTDDGAVDRSRMVLRIPAAEFAQAMADLEQVGRLESSDTATDDVTDAVIDTQVRIRAQERSLRRIEVLLDRAQKIGDIVRIESELTRRQADLDALKQTQAYYDDQTSMSTITVHLSRIAGAAPKAEKEQTGFLTGLTAGWGALKGAALVAATVVGALLPWLIVLLVLALPVWLLVRRRTPGARGALIAAGPATGPAAAAPGAASPGAASTSAPASGPDLPRPGE